MYLYETYGRSYFSSSGGGGGGDGGGGVLSRPLVPSGDEVQGLWTNAHQGPSSVSQVQGDRGHHIADERGGHREQRYGSVHVLYLCNAHIMIHMHVCIYLYMYVHTYTCVIHVHVYICMYCTSIVHDVVAFFIIVFGRAVGCDIYRHIMYNTWTNYNMLCVCVCTCVCACVCKGVCLCASVCVCACMCVCTTKGSNL